MGWRWFVAAFLVCLLSAATVVAETLEERVKRLEQALEAFKKEEAHEREIQGQAPATQPGEAPNVQQLGAQGQGAERKYGSIMQGSGKLIYARPFVSNPKAVVGGYTDVEYINRARQGTPSSIDVHRFVPFIYGDISEHVKFASEIEIEHGIREGTETEVSLEFATIDYLLNDKVNLRAGVVLLPVGKFNLLHDAPLRDLTERPLVAQLLYGVVLAETGAGAYGTFYPTRRSKLDYEIYVTTGYNGFNGGGCQAGSAAANSLTCTNVITEKDGLKDARQRKSHVDDGFDNNNGKAIVGRIAFSPFLGLEIGGSGYTGTYDPFSKRRLSIWAVDWTVVRGPFELIGESIWAYAQGNDKLLDGSACVDAFGHLCPRRMSGYYIQGNYHFLPELLTRLAPSFFRPEVSTLTAMVRWEEVNTNKDFRGGLGDRQRLTLGVNYRPTEDTVFKADFQYSPKEINVNDQRIHDTAFILSAATYF
ncbi:porin [Candidatus Nitrospira bockiana]